MVFTSQQKAFFDKTHFHVHVKGKFKNKKVMLINEGILFICFIYKNLFRRKLREDEEEKNKDNPKKKRKMNRKREPINAATHSEAIYQVIQVNLTFFIKIFFCKKKAC